MSDKILTYCRVGNKDQLNSCDNCSTYDDKIEKLIERLREIKNDMDLTNEQISKISGLSASWIEAFFDGGIKHPRFYETIKLASILGVSPAEIDKIFDVNVR